MTYDEACNARDSWPNLTVSLSDGSHDRVRILKVSKAGGWAEIMYVDYPTLRPRRLQLSALIFGGA